MAQLKLEVQNDHLNHDDVRKIEITNSDYQLKVVNNCNNTSANNNSYYQSNIDDYSKSKQIINENSIQVTKQLNNFNIEDEGKYFEIPFRLLAIPTATIQISSLVFCLSWSIRFNFYESTATHCQVENYLPSLSATLDFTPQREVWRACVCLTGGPRFFISYLYYRLIYKSRLLLLLHWIEIVALIGLSIIDSMRYFGK